MTDYVARDPRGFFVILSASVWKHAEPHHESLKGGWRFVAQTLTKPHQIFDNVARPGFPPRTGEERYCAYFDFLGGHIVVPVRKLSAAENVAGYGMVPAGARAALTAYVSSETPRGSIIWSST